MKIGVFDSGLGGLSVAKALEKAFPEHAVVFRHDSKHLPYGTKKPEVILGYVQPILQSLVDAGCDVIVVACNTVSTTLINELRDTITVPLVAIEPLVKPAAKLTQTKVIAVCATPTTLASERYKWLKTEYAADVKVLEPDCRSWAGMIEKKKFDAALIADEIEDVLELGADVIVLGFTYYHWILQDVQAIAKGRAKVIHQENEVVLAVKQQIKALT